MLDKKVVNALRKKYPSIEYKLTGKYPKVCWEHLNNVWWFRIFGFGLRIEKDATKKSKYRLIVLTPPKESHEQRPTR